MSDLERAGEAYAAACDASPEDWRREARAAFDLIVALYAELNDTKAEVERLTELVDDLTIQSTYGEHDANTFDSGAITAYAEGLRDMARRGRVRITHERYRRVIAEFTEEELARQRAVVDAARATLEVKDE
jgi:hypothetical protein